MRKVLFKRGTLDEREEWPTTVYSDFIYEGVFHMWVTTNYYPDGQSTVFAMIELTDGTIEQVHFSHIKFVS